MAFHLQRSSRTRGRQRFVAHWLLLALLQQALFATGTMAGSGADGGAWVTLCTGSSDVAKLVYIGDQEPQSSHAQSELCAFSVGVSAVSHVSAQVSKKQPSFAFSLERASQPAILPKRVKLPRAPPLQLS